MLGRDGLVRSPRDGAESSSHDAGDGADALFFLRAKYALLGKSEWWWLQDDAVEEIHRRLERDHVVVVDGFATPEATRELRDEIKRAHDAGALTPGVLAGGRTGAAASYTMSNVRGDRVGWFDGRERAADGASRWTRLPDAMRRCDTLVAELGALGGDPGRVESRSKAMCTVYPGGGARYVRHVDNAGENGRLITALLYLNPEWEEGDGGELRVFRCLRGRDALAGAGFVECDAGSLSAADAFETVARRRESNRSAAAPRCEVLLPGGAGGLRPVATIVGGGPEETAAIPVRLTDVAPLGGRLVLFKSDARVPHEVLPARSPRYAVTLWYFDANARTRTSDDEGGVGAKMTEAEKRAVDERVAREETMVLHGDAHDASAPPLVPAPCEASARRRRGTGPRDPRAAAPGNDRGERGGEAGERRHVLVLEALGLRDGARGAPARRRRRIGRRRAQETDARARSGEARPTTARDVEAAGRRAEASEASDASDASEASEASEPAERCRREDVFKSDALDCVGVGGTLGWTPETAFTPMPPPVPREPGAPPRGVDLSDATDWEDFFQPRWALAGLEGERPTLTPHALDGLSFPVTLAMATQLAPVRDATDAARAGRTGAPGAAASAVEVARRTPRRVAPRVAPREGGRRAFVGDAAGARCPDGRRGRLRPHGAVSSGAHRVLARVCASAPQARGGTTGGRRPDVVVAEEDVGVKKRAAALVAGGWRAHGVRAAEPLAAYLSRLPERAPLLVSGFNTGMGGGGGALARAWSLDVVEALRRPNACAVFTAANDYADLAGELAIFRALGADVAVGPKPNPFRAYTHTVAEDPQGGETDSETGGRVGTGGGGETGKATLVGGLRRGRDEATRWSCANAFFYVVRGFLPGRGLDAGLSVAQLGRLAEASAERSAGKAWDSLGMRR